MDATLKSEAVQKSRHGQWKGSRGWGGCDGRLMSRGDIGNAATTSRMADEEGIWSTHIKCELGKRAYSPS